MVCVVSEKCEYWERVYVKGEQKPKFVSNYGKIMDAYSGKLGVLTNNGAGYMSVHIGDWKRDYIHRLVATAFIPNPNNLPQINHIDYNKSNNRVDNLEWIKRSDNILDAHRKGKMKKRTDNGQINVLTKEQVVDLYTSVKRDKVGISEKARQMGIPRTTASSIMNKRSRSNITDLLDIEFANDQTSNTH